jgi:Ca2+-binding EF-hand superfamily protein
VKKKAGRSDALNDPKLAELRESFRQCDSDKDGYVEYEEFATLLDNLGADMTRQEKHIGFQAIDTDDDQRIDFGEFAEWWRD